MRLLVVLLLTGLIGIGNRRIDGFLGYADANTIGNLYNEVLVFLFFDDTEDAACGDNIAAGLEAIAEFLDIFLTLLLRTNHEEVEDDEESNNHQDRHQTAAALGGLKEHK